MNQDGESSLEASPRCCQKEATQRLTRGLRSGTGWFILALKRIRLSRLATLDCANPLQDCLLLRIKD